MSGTRINVDNTERKIYRNEYPILRYIKGLWCRYMLLQPPPIFRGAPVPEPLLGHEGEYCLWAIAG